MAVVIKPPKQLLVPLNVEEKLLMGPGPTNAHQRVLNACAQPMLSIVGSRFYEIMDEVKLGLQYVWQTKNTHTFALSGTGHSGMEASVINMTERGERILICENGFWGERASNIAKRTGKYMNLQYYNNSEVSYGFGLRYGPRLGLELNSLQSFKSRF